jgi:hypothetical protein
MELMWQMAAVGLVFLMLAGALWWFRGKGMVQIRRPFTNGRANRPLSAVDRLNLSPQHSLHLVRWGARGLLVAAHAHGCTLIAEAPWAELEPMEEPAPRSGAGKAARA